MIQLEKNPQSLTINHHYQTMKTTKTTKLIKHLGLGFLLLLMAACGDKEKKMSKGFVLPEGDTESGKQAFIELQCHRCHAVAGEVLPEDVAPVLKAPRLGGEVYKVRSYGELVTSVINPKHSVSKDWEGDQSPMPSVNDKMTVKQMVDIVAFLNAHYVKLEPAYEVPYYGP